jgi:outer membrane protein OmpA-like peptidoglycan-associated protein
MTQLARAGVLVPVALLVLVSGCATKGWVREELGRKEAELGQRIAKVDDRVGQESQRIEGRVNEQTQQYDSRFSTVDSRFNTVESNLGSTSEAVRGARERADAAAAKADSVDSRLTRLWTNRFNPKVVDTLSVQFGFDRADLDDRAQTALLGIARELQANPGLVVELVGYTDMKGSREYNYQLSQRRVDAVRRFLAEQGVQLGRIQAVALGAVPDRGTPESQKRRVVAKLMIDQD